MPTQPFKYTTLISQGEDIVLGFALPASEMFVLLVAQFMWPNPPAIELNLPMPALLRYAALFAIYDLSQRSRQFLSKSTVPETQATWFGRALLYSVGLVSGVFFVNATLGTLDLAADISIALVWSLFWVGACIARRSENWRWLDEQVVEL